VMWFFPRLKKQWNFWLRQRQERKALEAKKKEELKKEKDK
jgi:uncharacterized protein YjiS (DUF1127 family)